MGTLHAAARVAPLLVCVGASAPAHAESCHGTLRAADVVRCALAASPELRSARAAVDVVAARRTSVGLWLPANPVLSGQLEGDVRGGLNPNVVSPTVEWQVGLSQELEIAGQRGRRLAVNDAEAEAQRRRLAVVEQDIVAAALRSYYEAVAARASVGLVEELSAAIENLAHFAEERAKESLLAPIDAHLVRAEAVRFGVVRADTQRRLDVARARLAILIGADQVDVVDELPLPASTPSTAALTAVAMRQRAEIGSAQADRTAADRQAIALRRARVPNPTLAASTGTNVLGEQFVAGTLSIPLPLPAPFGHTNAGETREALAHRDQADASIEQQRRRVRVDVAEAAAGERARAAALALYTPELIAQARADVQALREGLATRQLSARDALVSERTLIELLLGGVEARLAYAQALVDLQRATGSMFAVQR